jgi:hypothetical protein
VALGFRASGARTKADVSSAGSPLSFGMPLGHVATDWLLWVVVTDDNAGPASTPSGWSFLGSGSAGTSANSPYTGRPHVWLYQRFDDGSLGTSQQMAFSRNSWPGGNPYVLGWISAYTGVNQTGAVERIDFANTTSTAAAMAHPQETTVTPNSWLLSIRGVVSDNVNLTFTNSVGTDVARVSEGMTNPSSPSAALFDSNADLTAGLQTQRTTTASNVTTYGGVAVSIVLKPASAANAVFAQAGVATGTGAAYDATTTSTQGGWDLCGPNGLPTYSFAIDWNNDGNFTASSAMLMLGLMGTGGVDEATQDLISDVTISYGRDQNRQLNPAAVGTAAFSLINVSRKYSPEWTSSVLYGTLEPARPMRAQVSWGGTTFPLFNGRIDDFNVKADMSDRTVDFTFLDALNDLSRITLSTGVYQSMRTGDLIDAILDEVGWTAGRQIDLGATIVKYWWADQTDALSAIQDLVKSEGAPSLAYVASDGTFVFHDRHHRVQNSTSTTVQGTYAQPAVFDCNATDLPGLDFTAPFAYAHGWRDIVNSVTFDVTERLADDNLSVVWSTEDTITLTSGQTTVVEISTTDPFIDAISPVLNTDYTYTGTGTPLIMINRTSGVSLRISIIAQGGAVSVNALQIRARLIPVQRNLKIHRDEPGSISKHGERSYPDQAPWANANDADAIAGAILLRYAERRPTVDMRVVTKDPTHFVQIVTRTVGDRIHIRNDEMGLDDDFFVERITHTIQRANVPGQPPVHAVIFGCEKATVNAANPFRFDVRGAGFDQGIFDPTNTDSPTTVFQFDHPTNGQFDFGVYGT